MNKIWIAAILTGVSLAAATAQAGTLKNVIHASCRDAEGRVVNFDLQSGLASSKLPEVSRAMLVNYDDDRVPRPRATVEAFNLSFGNGYKDYHVLHAQMAPKEYVEWASGDVGLATDVDQDLGETDTVLLYTKLTMDNGQVQGRPIDCKFKFQN